MPPDERVADRGSFLDEPDPHDPFFQTGQRNIEVLRKRMPTPLFFLHPVDAAREGIQDGDWARLETPTGHVIAKVAVQESMKEGHLRVPHGWWYPELKGQAELAGAFISSDAVLCDDADEFLDGEQGTPHFKGFPGRIVKLDEPPDLPTQVSKADGDAMATGIGPPTQSDLDACMYLVAIRLSQRTQPRGGFS